jgi:hypothetical protein
MNKPWQNFKRGDLVTPANPKDEQHNKLLGVFLGYSFPSHGCGYCFISWADRGKTEEFSKQIAVVEKAKQ